jgi:hypothetical protein
MSMLVQLCAALLLGLWTARVSAEPVQPLLTITAGTVTNRFTAAELLSRTDLGSLQIPPQVDYKVSLTVQAVQMPAFPPTVLPNTDPNALIAYLKQIANQRSR